MQQTWFITGSSRGFGRALVQAALDAGDRVVATARRPEQLKEFTDTYGDRVLPLALDVTDKDAVDTAIRDAVAHFGRVDVVVNNAGYANIAPIETGGDEDFRTQFETNFWASTTSRKRSYRNCVLKRAASSCSSPRSAGASAVPRASPATRQPSSLSTGSAGCSRWRRRHSA